MSLAIYRLGMLFKHQPTVSTTITEYALCCNMVYLLGSDLAAAMWVRRLPRRLVSSLALPRNHAGFVSRRLYAL